MAKYKISVLPGDGVGNDVMEACMIVLNALKFDAEYTYGDIGWGSNPGTAWDDFDGERPDFAVVYEGEGDAIVSSRRWEAWRMGIEDYELLTMYARKKGEGAAQALAREVVDNPADSGRADRIRRQMLEELARK